jgi:hypothetical protein
VLALDPQDRSWSGVHEPGMPISPPDKVWRLPIGTPDLEYLPLSRGLVRVARREDDVISLVCLHRPSPFSCLGTWQGMCCGFCPVAKARPHSGRAPSRTTRSAPNVLSSPWIVVGLQHQSNWVRT